MAPLGAERCLDTTRHSYNKVSDHLRGYFEPFFVDTLPLFLHTRNRLRILGQHPLQVLPQVLNRIQVQRLGGSLQKCQAKLLETFLSLFGGVFRIIVLLKYYLLFLKLVVLHGVK